MALLIPDRIDIRHRLEFADADQLDRIESKIDDALTLLKMSDADRAKLAAAGFALDASTNGLQNTVDANQPQK